MENFPFPTKRIPRSETLPAQSDVKKKSAKNGGQTPSISGIEPEAVRGSPSRPRTACPALNFHFRPANHLHLGETKAILIHRAHLRSLRAKPTPSGIPAWELISADSENTRLLGQLRTHRHESFYFGKLTTHPAMFLDGHKGRKFGTFPPENASPPCVSGKLVGRSPQALEADRNSPIVLRCRYCVGLDLDFAPTSRQSRWPAL